MSSFLLLLDLAAESNGVAGCVIHRGFDEGRGAVCVVGLGPGCLARSTGFLPFPDGSIDLAVVVGLDRARVPARVVLETERVLRPGRLGVVIRSGQGRIRLVGESAPVTALLRSSDVVGAREVNGSVVIVFRKRRDPRRVRCGPSICCELLRGLLRMSC